MKFRIIFTIELFFAVLFFIAAACCLINPFFREEQITVEMVTGDFFLVFTCSIITFIFLTAWLNNNFK